MNCVVVFPTKNESACTSNTLGLVLNFNEPLAPTNSKPTPLPGQTEPLNIIKPYLPPRLALEALKYP